MTAEQTQPPNSSPAHRYRLGELLMRDNKLTEAQLDFALRVQQTSEMLLGEILIANNLASEQDVYQAISGQFGIEFVADIEEKDIDINQDDDSELNNVPLFFNIMKQYLCVPLKSGKLATANPREAAKTYTVFGVRELVVVPPSPVLIAAESVFIKHYEKHFQTIQSRFEKENVSQTVAPLVDAIIRKAVLSRASDIHFEIGNPSCYVRFRIDGDFHTHISYDLRLHRNMVNFIIMRGVGNPSNDQRFDDAAFEYELSPKYKIGIRVSKVPTVTANGSHVVLRIHKKDNMLIELDKVGYLPEQVTQLRRVVRKPHGMIIVAGPVGSGKTSTLYSLVNERRGQGTKILSVEDPIEIDIPFVEQVQVNEEAEVTFDTAIRRFLRHDPDIMMVGEIRDAETAKMAFNASLTGHLVLATLHANNRFDVFTRLHDLGVSYRNMASLRCIVSQRLVKKLCECQTGCNKCNYTRFHGRIPVAEIIEIDKTLAHHLYFEDMTTLKNTIDAKSRPISDIANEYVAAGLTTREEVERRIDIDDDVAGVAV